MPPIFWNSKGKSKHPPEVQLPENAPGAVSRVKCKVKAALARFRDKSSRRSRSRRRPQSRPQPQSRHYQDEVPVVVSLSAEEDVPNWQKRRPQLRPSVTQAPAPALAPAPIPVQAPLRNISFQSISSPNQYSGMHHNHTHPVEAGVLPSNFSLPPWLDGVPVRVPVRVPAQMHTSPFNTSAFIADSSVRPKSIVSNDITCRPVQSPQRLSLSLPPMEDNKLSSLPKSSRYGLTYCKNIMDSFPRPDDTGEKVSLSDNKDDVGEKNYIDDDYAISSKSNVSSGNDSSHPEKEILSDFEKPRIPLLCQLSSRKPSHLYQNSKVSKISKLCGDTQLTAVRREQGNIEPGAVNSRCLESEAYKSVLSEIRKQNEVFRESWKRLEERLDRLESVLSSIYKTGAPTLEALEAEEDYRDGCVVREAESLDVVVDISNISNPQVFRKVCTAKSTIEAITTRDKNSTIYEWNTKRFQLERNASDSNEINKDSKETYMKTDREMCNEGETKGEDSEKPPDIEITKVETEKIPKPEQAGFIRQYWRPKSLGIYPDTCEKPSRKSSLHSVSSHSGPSRRNIRNDRLEGPEGMDDIIRNRRKISLLYIPKETRRKGKKRRDIWLRIKKDMNKNVGQGTRSAISKWLVPQRVYKVQEKQSPSRNEANRPLESEGAVETKIRVLVNPDEDLFPGGTTIQEAHEEGLKEVDRLLNLVEDDDMTIEKRGVELVKDPYEEAAHSLDDIPIVTDDIIKPVSGGRVDTHPWPARRKRDVSRFADERKHVDSSTNSCSFSPERRYAEAYEKLVDRGCAQISSGPPRLSSVRIDATPGSFKDARSPVDLLGDYREQSHCDISLYCEDDWQDGVRRKALKSRLRQAGNLENVAGGFNQSEVPLITSGLTHSIHTSSLKNDTLPGSFFRIGGCLQNISANVNLAEGTSVTEVGVSPGNGFKIRAWQDTLGSQIVDTPITKKRMQTSPVMSDSSPWGTLRTGYPPDKELRERLDASSLKTGPSPASILRRRLDKSSLNKSNRATGSSGQVVLCDNTVQINLSPYDAFSPTDRTSCMRNDSSVENIERKNLKAPSPKSVRYTGESVSCKPSRDQPGMTVDKPINTPETMTRKAASKISTESRSPNMVTEKEMGLRFRADVDKVQIMLPKLAGKDFDRVLIKVEQNEAVRKMTSDGRCVPVLSSELCCGLSDRKKSKKKCAFFKKGKSIQSYNVACSNPFGYQQPADQIVDNICSLRRLSSHSLENLVIQGCEIAEVVLMDRLDKEIVSLGVKQTQLREEEDESFFQRLCRQLKMEKWTRSSNTVTESNKPDDTPGNVDRFDTEAHRNKLFQPVRTVPSQRFEFREENGSRRNYRRRRRNHSDIDDKHVHEVTQRQRHRKKRRDRSNSNRKHEQNKSCSESEKTIKKRKPHAISGIISRVGREGKLIETFTFNPLWSPTRVSRKKPPDKRDLISKLFPSTNFIKQQSNHHGSMLEIHSTLKLRTPDGRTYHLDPESLEISDPQRVLDSSSWKRKFRSDDRVSSQTRRIDDVKSLREAVDLKSDTVNLKSQKEAVNLNIANADDSSSCASKNDYELYTVFSEKIYFTRNDFLSSENFSKHDNVHVETITVSCPSEMKDERKETVGSVAKGGKSLNFGGKEGRKNLNFGAKEGCRNLNFVGDNERNFDRSRKEVKNTNLGGRGRKRFEFR